MTNGPSKESGPPRTAVVTGASRGIGRGIALALAREGFHLLLNFRSNHAAAEMTAMACLEAAQQEGKSIAVHTIGADVAQWEGRQKIMDTARSEFKSLNLLVNNAGVAPLERADLLESTEESFDLLLSINLKAPFFLSQAAAQWMIQNPASDSIRAIININSVSAYAASINRGEYCVSKAGLAMVSQLFAVRLAQSGIGVFEIRPGIIQSDMTRPVQEKYDRLIEEGLTPIRRWGTPEDVGKAVTAIAGGAFPFSTGQVFDVDGGFHLRSF